MSPAPCHMEETLMGISPCWGAGGWCSESGGGPGIHQSPPGPEKFPERVWHAACDPGTTCWPGGVWKMVSESQAGSLGGPRGQPPAGPRGDPRTGSQARGPCWTPHGSSLAPLCPECCPIHQRESKEQPPGQRDSGTKVQLSATRTQRASSRPRQPQGESHLGPQQSSQHQDGKAGSALGGPHRPLSTALAGYTLDRREAETSEALHS